MNKSIRFSKLVKITESYFGVISKKIGKFNANCINLNDGYLIDITPNKIHFIFLGQMDGMVKTRLISEINIFVSLYLSDQTIAIKWYTPETSFLFNDMQMDNMILI
ncbi:hypothetical protein [Paenibacillus sp. FSL H8-0175]